MGFSLRFCGPKYSICCMLLSVWGVIQLALMAIFFHIHSVALTEDIHVDEDIVKNLTTNGAAGLAKFKDAVEEGYHVSSVNCAIAAGLYIVTFVISAWQVYLNNKKSVEQEEQMRQAIHLRRD